MLFREFQKKYFDYKKIYNKTADFERSRCKRYFYSIFEKELNDIVLNDIEMIQISLFEKQLSNKTINNIISLLSSMFNFALKRDLISKNYCLALDKLKINNSRDRFLSKNEIHILLKKVKFDYELNLFCLIALTTGARLQSICNLKRKNISFEDKIILIEDQKNNTSYNAFINTSLYSELIKIKNFNTNDFLFKTKTKTLQARLLRILNELFNFELEKDDRKNRVVVHTLRHTFASQLAINNTPIHIIQKLLNHKDIKMTMRYAKLLPNSGQKEVEKLSDFF